ncbi:zinc finger protein ZAT12-like [Panicum virgatum]|uniref:zinc finger protein ZAT12-like n=1 Tax=Panicum virgatum TaxID=38727 RepID=UPI0019D59190|nr:zinc finger protein ZAT12-like [Panicum virgatum]
MDMERRQDDLRFIEEDEDGHNDGHRAAAASFHHDVFLSLSCGSSSSSSSSGEAAGSTPPRTRRHRRRRGQAFACTTCGRQFATFQALGGHRTSHLRRPPAKPKRVVAHACGTCGLGFATGQALGGHMRRHRWAAGPAMGPGDLDLTQVIVLKERPSSTSSSLQLLDLFV